MNWDSIKTTIAKAAPLVGSLIGGPAGIAVGGLVAHALGVPNEPDAIARALQDPESALKLKALELTHVKELRALALQSELARIQSDDKQFSESQSTIRTEMEHGNDYVKETRPRMARGSFMAGTCYILVAETARLISAAYGGDINGADTAIAATLYGPAGFYMTMRTVDAFSKSGKS